MVGCIHKFLQCSGIKNCQNWPAGGAAIQQKQHAGWFVLDEVMNLVNVGSIKRTNKKMRMYHKTKLCQATEW